MRIRIGKVTTLYPSEGKVRVLYEDISETSVKLPLLTFNNEYRMPKIGTTVVTIHMENSSAGFVLGEYWSGVNKPNETGEKLYRKSIDEASLKYSNGQLEIYSPQILLRTPSGTITAEQLITVLNRLDDIENRLSGLGV